MLMAYAQCQPSRSKVAKSQLLSQGRQLMEQVQTCVRDKTTAMQELMVQLKDQLEPVQVGCNWFSPKQSNWFKQQGWKAVALPEDEDELSDLDAL